MAKLISKPIYVYVQIRPPKQVVDDGCYDSWISWVQDVFKDHKCFDDHQIEPHYVWGNECSNCGYKDAGLGSKSKCPRCGEKFDD